MLRSTSSEIFAFYLKKKKKVVKKPKETCQPHSQVLFQIVPAAARGMSHAESREAFLKAFHLVHMIFFNFTFLSVFLFLEKKKNKQNMKASHPRKTRTRMWSWRAVTQAENPISSRRIPWIPCTGCGRRRTGNTHHLPRYRLEACLKLLRENRSWHRRKSSRDEWERVAGKESAIECISGRWERCWQPQLRGSALRQLMALCAGPWWVWAESFHCWFVSWNWP